MARRSADTSIPPSLRAIGGWLEADWFDPAILSEPSVVGLSLPKLGVVRKQDFQLVERITAGAREGNHDTGNAKKPQEAQPGGIGEILEAIGIVRAASFRRPTFFFEATPAIYFAEISHSRLKLRATEAFRRNLVGICFRGCVLQHDTSSVTAMFWPGAETDITAFVRAAAPPYPLHTQFDQADIETRSMEPSRRGLFKRGRIAPSPPAPGPGARESRAFEAERLRLLDELQVLRARVAELAQSRSATDAMELLGLDDSRLKSMLRLLHPDKHANSEAANEAAKWVNGLRDLLKAKGPT